MNRIGLSVVTPPDETSFTNDLLDELRQLIADLGKDGGIISPSVYDTAQVLRFYPPDEGVEPALEWLLSEQKADGGWGDPAVTIARDVPTLAAVLALHQHDRSPRATESVKEGLQFLSTRTDQWANVHIDLLPIAAEMIIPGLIRDARQLGLHIDATPYAYLFELHSLKSKALSTAKIGPGSASSYSWEALNLPPDPGLLDAYGSVGHSPAATARWLQLVRCDGAEFGAKVERARRYLLEAAMATGENIPGVVPTVWPLPVFEYIYSLHAVFQNAYCTNNSIEQMCRPHLRRIQTLLSHDDGLSFSEHFVPDVDCTSVGAVVLAQHGGDFRAEDILKYRQQDHFFTFASELNPSVFSNAHALSALSYKDIRRPRTERFLLDRQLENGAWMPDKWHSSNIYTTLEVLDLLLTLGHTNAALRAKQYILATQQSDGRWRTQEGVGLLATAYAITALRKLEQHGALAEDELGAIRKGREWLMANYRPELIIHERQWVGKDLYSPYRVDQAYVLSAILTAQNGTSDHLIVT